MKDRIFVTGATGLIGLHIVEHLTDLGYAVTAGVRSTSNTSVLRQLPNSDKIKLATIDLADNNSLIAAMNGCLAVVHCAGSVDMQGERAKIFATNVEGTKNLVAEAAAAPWVKQFIHISSLSVITGQEDQYDVDETASIRYCGEAYADSKVDAEKAVAAAGKSLNTTILRPGFVYGPYEQAWMPRLIANLQSGKVFLIDGGTRSTNVIYVRNLCRAVELALFNKGAYGRTYNLTDGNTPTKKQLFDAICDGLGFPRVTKSIPRPLFQLICAAVTTISPLVPVESRKQLTKFSRGAYRLAAVNQGFSIKRAEEELAYSNLIPFEVGMSETLWHFQGNAKGSGKSSIRK